MSIELNDKTRVPLFVVISTMPVIIVSVFWIASLGSRVGASEQRTDKIVDKIHLMEMKDDKIIDNLIEIKERLARIEERLKR